MADAPQPAFRMMLTHFIVSDDVERSRRFYTEVLGGTEVFGPVPVNIALANSFIVINSGGGPTDDKPTVTLETPVRRRRRLGLGRVPPLDRMTG